jgi:preprotein translocase subunit YajC
MDLGFLVILAAMFGVMWMLLIRPQRQQQRRHADMIERLRAGDEVITVGGIYGDIVEVEPDRVTLEIAEDVQIEVAKRAIASVVPPEEAGELEALDEPAEVGEPETAEERSRRR